MTYVRLYLGVMHNDTDNQVTCNFFIEFFVLFFPLNSSQTGHVQHTQYRTTYIYITQHKKSLSLSRSSLESCDLTLNTSLALKSLIIKQLSFFSFHNTFSIPKIKTNELRDKKKSIKNIQKCSTKIKSLRRQLCPYTLHSTILIM